MKMVLKLLAVALAIGATAQLVVAQQAKGNAQSVILDNEPPTG
jgi:hypothetical protein